MKKISVRLPISSLLVIIFAMGIFSSASASERDGDFGNTPYYARLGPEDTFQDGEWAVIVFYHPPECIPDDFNLWEFFDFNAWGCPVTTKGFAIWKYGIGDVTGIFQSNLHGLGAVPVWFVRWNELQPAIADGGITITDLEAMSSLLKGTASLYHELLHPSGMLLPNGNHRPVVFENQASGNLEDGRSFFTKIIQFDDLSTNVKIVIK